MVPLRLERVEKRFGSRVVLRDIDCVIGAGERVAVVGPSGGGKTTLLRMIAGLERPERGRIWIDNTDVTDVPPVERGVALVFQSLALYPHLDVFENIAFAPRRRGERGAALARIVRSAAELVRCGDLLSRRVTTLSGGERQRVALARALASRPRVLLFDEPLAALDAQLRADVRSELLALQQRLGTTTIYVTHDQAEAMTLGGRVALVSDASLVQFAAPRELYDRPADLRVAQFIGTPAIAVLAGDVAGGTFASSGGLVVRGARVPAGRYLLGLRAEAVQLAREDAALRAEVIAVEETGANAYARLACGGDMLTAAIGVGEARPAVGERVGIEIVMGRALYFTPDGRRVDATSDVLV